MTASVRPGMGALPYAGGTTFRVWAPFAKSVCVAGTFNSWHMTATLLTHEGNGYWSADIPEARVGDQYKFVLTSPFRNDPLWKNDPVLALPGHVRMSDLSPQSAPKRTLIKPP